MGETPRTAPGLTHEQKKYLRGLGHQLSPLVFIGREGLGEHLYKAVDEALEAHELIKVKIIPTSSVDKHQAASVIPAETGSILVQLIGKTMLLYRRNRQKPPAKRIKLP